MDFENASVPVRNECKVWFRHATVMEMIHEGGVVDGRRGGLVIGRSHAEGNIYLLQQVDQDRYEIPASMEGGEYLFSHVAYLKYKERVEEINAWGREYKIAAAIPLSAQTRIINTYSEPSDKVILIDHRGQFIINRMATSKFLEEIETINHMAGDFTDFRIQVHEIFGD